VQAPVVGAHAPALLQVLLMLPSNPSEHAAVQVTPVAEPAHVAGQPTVLLGDVAVGVPAHVVREQVPDTGSQVPHVPQVLLTLPVKPAEQRALHTVSAAAPAQLLGQPAVLAGAVAVGVP
jgi:hypothetical protein